MRVEEGLAESTAGRRRDGEDLPLGEPPGVDAWVGSLECGDGDPVLPGDARKRLAGDDPMRAGLRCGGRKGHRSAGGGGESGGTGLRYGTGSGRWRVGGDGQEAFLGWLDERIRLGDDLPAENTVVVVEDVDFLQEHGVRPAQVFEFELLLVAEHPLRVAPGQLNLGVADAIGGRLVAELTIALAAADFEVALIMVHGHHLSGALIGQAGAVKVSEGEVGEEVLGVGFQSPVVAFAGIFPAALIRPAQPVLIIAFTMGIAGRPVEPVASAGPDGQHEETQAAQDPHPEVWFVRRSHATHGHRLTPEASDFKLGFFALRGGWRTKSRLESGRAVAKVNRMKSPWIVLLLLFVTAGCAKAPKTVITPTPGAAGRQVETMFRQVVTRTNSLRFLLSLPAEYGVDPAKRWPMVLFLHGAGERGTDLKKVAVHGPPKLVQQGRSFPFILVSPQCPENQVWDTEVLMALVDTLQSELQVDPSRTYATGLSMGGYGTWALASRYPDRFAAVAPVCGGGERIRALLPNQREALKTLGVWAFHGGKDNVVALSESERMVDAFKRAGVTDIQLTVYPEAGHDSWTEAFNTAGLYDWLLKHHR